MLYDSNSSNRILWVDWIKALAIIAVAVIHVSGVYLENNLLFTSNWYVAVVFESFSRYAVVFFVMVSGFLILRKPEPITNIPKRFKRIFIPFAFWMFVFAFFYYFMVDAHPINVLGFLEYFLYGFLDPTSICLIFWFVYMILGLYVLAPILSKWILNSDIFEIEYFLIIWGFVVVLHFLMVLIGFESIIYDYLRYFSGAVGYFVLGYYLVFKDSKYLKSRKFGLLLFIIGTLMAIIGTIAYPLITGVQTFEFLSVGDITPNACLQAVGLFIIVKNTNFESLSNKINTIVVLLSMESYGFYLSHLLVVGLFRKLPFFSVSENAIIVIPVFAVVVLVVTNVGIYIMGKIPFFRRFTGFKSIL